GRRGAEGAMAGQEDRHSWKSDSPLRDDHPSRLLLLHHHWLHLSRHRLFFYIKFAISRLRRSARIHLIQSFEQHNSRRT
ncbi:hypothetical protein PMAYCL1PPCAC_10420, partial [Pristionchus mayeri]